jgi:hypothetical protein
MAAELLLNDGHQVTVFAPYLLTALITRPQRLVYLSSVMHPGGDPALDDPQWESAAGHGCDPMRSNPGGWPPRWADREHPMIYRPRRRPGLARRER